MAQGDDEEALAERAFEHYAAKYGGARTDGIPEANLRVRAALMRSLGVSEWDPSTGRIVLGPEPRSSTSDRRADESPEQHAARVQRESEDRKREAKRRRLRLSLGYEPDDRLLEALP